MVEITAAQLNQRLDNFLIARLDSVPSNPNEQVQVFPIQKFCTRSPSETAPTYKPSNWTNTSFCVREGNTKTASR